MQRRRLRVQRHPAKDDDDNGDDSKATPVNLRRGTSGESWDGSPDAEFGVALLLYYISQRGNVDRVQIYSTGLGHGLDGEFVNLPGPEEHYDV